MITTTISYGGADAREDVDAMPDLDEQPATDVARCPRGCGFVRLPHACPRPRPAREPARVARAGDPGPSPARVYVATGEPPSRPPRRVEAPAEDRELVRVRTLFYALRPDCADPLRPPPKAPTAAPIVRIRDPMAGWGDVPASLEHGGGSASAPAALAAEAMARIGELPEDARVVARWLREHAVLATLRGLYVDVGLAFADDALAAAWAHDLTARRDGSAHHGRALVLATCSAWGLPEHKTTNT